MASSVVQAFNSVGEGLNSVGRDFGKLFGEYRGSGADAIDAANNGTDEDKKKYYAGGEGMYSPAIGNPEEMYQANLLKRTEEARAKQVIKNNSEVLDAKKGSTAGRASGRSGTISETSAPQGSLLGGGTASIGSKTLLGQ